MGCDIHYFTERFSDEPITNGPVDISEQRDNLISTILDDNKIEPRWISADSWELGDKDDWGDGIARWNSLETFYSGRNYHLFTVLAGVRSWDSSDAICEPKGIPDDASYTYKDMCNQWDGDAHSHSYFTLEELLEVDWGSKDLKWFEEETIKMMKKVDPDPKKVRCCFFFDN